MNSHYNDPITIMKVAKAHAFIVARTVFITVFSLSLILSIFASKGTPKFDFWLLSAAFGSVASSLMYWWIYNIKALSVINLTLDACHVEDTTGATIGDYRVVRNHPTPPNLPQ